MRSWLIGVCALVCTTAAWAADRLTVEIRPDDPKLYYMGRFDYRDAKGPRFQWSQSMVRIRFRGTDLQVKLLEEGNNDYQVITDSKTQVVVHPGEGEHVIDLARSLADGEHVVDFVKRTEGHVGLGQFLGFYLNAGGELLQPQKLPHKLEVIGDSISCGYGNEAASETAHWAPETQNAYMSYGAIASRELGSEYVCVAFSGKKMWPDNTMPELYDRILTWDPGSTWDYTKWQPDAVLINLATNDFYGHSPEEQGWVGAYEAFLHKVRKNYPQAMIYMASGSMMSGESLTVLKGYLAHIERDMQTQGETKLRVIHFDPQDGAKDGLGADWHPSVKTHLKMAAKLEQILEADLGWRPGAKPQ